MLKVTAVLLAGVIQIGQQAPPIDPADAAADRFYSCVEMMVPAYDDLVSPAGLVAQVLASECSDAALRWRAAMLATLPEMIVDDLYAQVMGGRDLKAIAMILRHRVSRR